MLDIVDAASEDLEDGGEAEEDDAPEEDDDGGGDVCDVPHDDSQTAGDDCEEEPYEPWLGSLENRDSQIGWGTSVDILGRDLIMHQKGRLAARKLGPAGQPGYHFEPDQVVPTLALRWRTIGYRGLL